MNSITEGDMKVIRFNLLILLSALKNHKFKNVDKVNMGDGELEEIKHALNEGNWEVL